MDLLLFFFFYIYERDRYVLFKVFLKFIVIISILEDMGLWSEGFVE